MIITTLAHGIFFMSFLAIGLYTALAFIHRKNSVPGKTSETLCHHLPRVSILRPLRHSDDGLEKNIEALYHLDYTDYEILYAIDSLHDPIVPVLEQIIQKYAHIPSRILATGNPSTVNPKVHKLACMAGAATGELYWVSDSNIRAEKNTLRLLVDEYLNTGAKIIFSPIRAGGAQSLGAILENAYINTFVSGNVITAWTLFREPVIVGKSMLIEKNSLDRFGGFSYFRDHLAEDYIMGKIFDKCHIPMSTHFTWVNNINRTTSVSGFISRMSRWAKLRYHINRPMYIMEILANPVMFLLPFCLSIAPFSGGLKPLATVIALKTALELFNFFTINIHDRRKWRIILSMPFAIILKDILLFYIYLAPFFSHTVNWRGGRIAIGKDTIIVHDAEFLLLKGA